jgi:hypothetical protein
MKTTIDFSYSIGDQVQIIEIEKNATVVSLYFGETGCQYQVTYFVNDEIKRNYFYGFELKLIEDVDSRKMGFLA